MLPKLKCLSRSHLPLLLFIVVFAAIGTYYLINSFAASSPNVYIAQTATGSANGTDCADAEPVSFFNTSSNWGSNSGQIGPGTTVHLCGTITANLTFYGSGTSGSPITLYFEPGANITMPACPGRGTGCVNTNSQTYLTIDGGSNGIIQNTADGTHLSEHVGSYAIEASNCSNCTVKDLTIQNIYVHDGSADYTEIDQTAVRAVDFTGSNFSLYNNTIHDVGWAVTFGNDNEQNVKVYKNNIYNVDHGVVPAFGGSAAPTGPIYIYDNHFHDFANWDTTSNAYHHDAIHCYGAQLASNNMNPASVGEQINGMYIYDNTFDGQIGGHATAWLFLEGGTNQGQTPCATSSSTIYVFNNLFTSTDYIPANPYMNLATGDVAVYNNTIVGTGPSTGSCFSGIGEQGVFQNNIVSSCEGLNSLNDSNNTYSSGSPDYNLYADGGGGNAFVVSNPPSTPSQCSSWGGWYPFSAFASNWQQCTVPAADPHSQAVTSALLNTDGSLQTGSPAIGAGTNLTSICSGQPNPGLGALCSDINGTPRPSTGAWDIGAYQYTSPITTDLNSDSHVNIFDLSIFLDHLGQTGTNLPGDFNSDGKVDTTDLTTLQGQWGR